MTRDVRQEKTNQIQEEIPNDVMFIMLRPSGMIHIPEVKRMLGRGGKRPIILTNQGEEMITAGSPSLQQSKADLTDNAHFI